MTFIIKNIVFCLISYLYAHPFTFTHLFFLFLSPDNTPSVCFLLASWGDNHISSLPLPCWYGKSSLRPTTNVNLLSVPVFSSFLPPPAFLLLPVFRFCFVHDLHIPFPSVSAASSCSFLFFHTPNYECKHNKTVEKKNNFSFCNKNWVQKPHIS